MLFHAGSLIGFTKTFKLDRATLLLLVTHVLFRYEMSQCPPISVIDGSQKYTLANSLIDDAGRVNYS